MNGGNTRLCPPEADYDAPLRVAEIFGPTIQGEGPSGGRGAMFVRLMGCNLACTWCDTPYTWDARRHDLAAEGTTMTAEEVIDRVTRHTGVHLVVITGGEPLLHQNRPGWAALIDGLARHGMDIEIETNGTVAPTEHTAHWARFNVSPKLANSGLPREARIKPGPLEALYGEDESAFKFVVDDVADLAEIDALIDYDGPLRYLQARRIWVMPQGTTPEEILAGARALAPEVLARGWNLALRQHVLIWPDEPRGR